jgi:hypothetical protein
LRWNGRFGTGVWLELCAACDTHRPATRAFIRWRRDPDRDTRSLPQLFDDGEAETMYVLGWIRDPEPDEASDSRRAHLNLVPTDES